jgi:hypothetical protein
MFLKLGLFQGIFLKGFFEGSVISLRRNLNEQPPNFKPMLFNQMAKSNFCNTAILNVDLQWAPPLYGIMVNGIMVNGIMVNGIMVNGIMVNGIMVNGIILLMGSNLPRLIKHQMSLNSILCIINIFVSFDSWDQLWSGPKLSHNAASTV